MNFSEWLHQQLTKRSWTHKDLSQHAVMAGYKISRVQITNILNENRKAGPDACIAIAYGLGLSREEVFKARGWLLYKPQEIVSPRATPEAAELIRALIALDDGTQQTLAQAFFGVLSAVTQVTKKEASETTSSASEEALQKESSQPEVAAPLVPVVDWIAELNDYPEHVQRDMVGVLRPRIRGLIDKLAEMWAYEEFLNKPLTQEEAIEFGETIAEFKRLFPEAWGPIEERVFGRPGGYKAASQRESMAAAA